MSSFSRTQDAVLKHVARYKSLPETINGTTLRSTTVSALKRRSALRETSEGWVLTETGKGRLETISENLSPRTNRLQSRMWWRTTSATFDSGQADYQYWDKARRGEAEGLQVAGLFLKPIASKKAAWCLGDLPQVSIDDETEIDGKPLEAHVTQWLKRNHSTIMMIKEEATILGDMYVSVNPDLSLVAVAPHVVEPIVNADDYSQFLGWRTWQTYPHPTEYMDTQTIMDEFTMRFRRRKVWRGRETSEQTWQMRLPVLPFVHIANNKRANERFGHSEGEALVNALHDYNELFDASADGVIRMGRPMLAIENIEDEAALNKVIALYGDTSTQTLADGTTENTPIINISSDDILLLVKASAKLLSPSSFTQDTMRMLEVIFMLFVQHTEIPEFALGTAIASSKASAEAQMPAFTRWIEKEQRRDELWLLHLIRAYVAILTFTRLGRVIDIEDSVSLKWMPLTSQDGALTLQAIDKAERLGVPSEYLVPHLPLDLDDQLSGILDDMEQAKAEREEFMRGGDEPFVPMPVPTDAPQDMADEMFGEPSVIQDYADELEEMEFVPA